jgi:branched-subunit amino acid aminotransferase/4-amino-4-deoxychorismate lyase
MAAITFQDHIDRLFNSAAEMALTIPATKQVDEKMILNHLMMNQGNRKYGA